jgi:hypothetical protein
MQGKTKFYLFNFNFWTIFRTKDYFCLSNFTFRSNFRRKEFLVLRSTQHGVAAIQIKVTCCFVAFLFLFLFLFLFRCFVCFLFYSCFDSIFVSFSSWSKDILLVWLIFSSKREKEVESTVGSSETKLEIVLNATETKKSLLILQFFSV